MKAYTGVLENGQAIHYVDKKRWFWTLSVLYPLQAFIAIALHASTGAEAWFLLPFIFNYGLAPLIDWLLGEDSNNPPEEVVMQLDQDRYYRRLTYAAVPLHYGLLRQKGDDGKLERCQPQHSWNSNHIFSNIVLFHLERHSDHHAYPLRRYS
jgi:hypothetical protein